MIAVFLFFICWTTIAFSCGDGDCPANFTSNAFVQRSAHAKGALHRDNWDVTAFDKTGPKEGHPMFGGYGDVKVDENVRNFKIFRLDREEKDLMKRDREAWPAKKGFKCDPSGSHFKTREIDPQDCQSRAIRNKFAIFQFSYTAPQHEIGVDKHGKVARCHIFKECTLIEGDWTVYESPDVYPELSAGKLCERKELPDVDEKLDSIKQYYKLQVNTPMECQQEAERKEYPYWAAKKVTFYKCEAFKNCAATAEADGAETYQWIEGVNPKMKTSNQKEVFVPFHAKAKSAKCKSSKTDKVREVWVTGHEPGRCWTVPVRCYWKRSSPCQLEWEAYTEYEMSTFYDCYVFPTCDAPERAESDWVLHGKSVQQWREASTCSLGEAAVRTSMDVTESVAISICQERAWRLGHKYYQVSGDGALSTCTSAQSCVRSSDTSGRVFESPENKATEVSCDAESKIRNSLSTIMEDELFWTTQEKSGALVHAMRGRSRANVLRAVFHDAQDYNRLMLQDRNTGNWSRVDVKSTGEFGGVDGCLFEPLARVFEGNDVDGKLATTDDKGAHLLNFNLQRRAMNRDTLRIDRSRYRFAERTCNHLCCDKKSPLTASEKEGFCGSASCDLTEQVSYMDRCMVDIMVFASNLIVKDAGGPEIPMLWGRRQGDCRNIFKKIDVGDDLKTERTGFIDGGLAALYKLHKVVEDFELMGFDSKGMAALMGAHSFGRLHKYTGSMTIRNTARGFCHDPSQAQPQLKSDGKGGYRSDGDSVTWTLKDTPEGQAPQNLEPKKSWGMGGVWDHTPDAFDNQYFVMLNTEDIGEVNNCCGPYEPDGGTGGCTKRGAPMQSTNYTQISGCGEVNWCARDKLAMVNTKHHFRDMRLYRLAADWALLDDADAKEEVRKFAADESAFHAAFRKAWTQVTSMGHSSDGALRLRSCSRK